MSGPAPQVYAFNTKVAPFDDVRVRQALVMALDRKKMSQAITNGLARPASNPYGDGSWVKCKDDGALPEDLEKAKALIKDYGKPVDFKMLVTATPRGRTVGQVLQQFWKRAGANMEIEQVDQATIPPRAFMRQFQLTPWRIVDLADPDIADVRQLPYRQPGGARQLFQSRTRQAARARAHHGRSRTSASRTIARSAGSSTRKRSGSGPSRTPTTRYRAPS